MGKFISLTTLIEGNAVSVNTSNIDFITTDRNGVCYIGIKGYKLYVQQTYTEVMILISTQG